MISRTSRVLVTLTVAQALGAAAAGLSLTASAVTVTRLAGSTTAAGLAQSATIVGAGLASVPISRLASRWGRMPSLRFAYAIALAGGLTATVGVLTDALVVFLFGLVGAGSGTAAGLALRFAAADLAAEPAKRPQYIAVILWFASIGSFAGPQFASLSATLGTPAAPFLVIASLYGVAIIATMLVTIPSTAPTIATPPIGVASPAERARTDTGARIAIAVSTVNHMAMVSLMGLAPVFLTEEQFTMETIGAIMSAHLVGMYAASPLFGLFVRFAGHRVSWALAAAGLVTACAVITLNTGSAVLFGLGLTALGLAWSLGMIASSAALAAVQEPDRLRVQGAADTLLNVGAVAASLSAGLVVGLASYPILVAGTGAVAIAVTALLGYDLARFRAGSRR